MRRVILVGKAGSGKDYFRDFCKNLMPYDVSYTTRPMRDGEIPGYTYNYLNDNQFNNMKLEESFQECVAFNGWQYGTSKENWDTKELFIMTPTGVSQVSAADRKHCTIIYFDISEDVRRERLAQRSDADSVERRLTADEKDFKDFKDFDIRVTVPKYNAGILFTFTRNFGYEI